MITIVYEVDCHCGGTATSATLAIGQPEEDGRVHIAVDLSIGQTRFECDDCGCTYYTGDIDIASDDEDGCAGSDVDEEDEEDDARVCHHCGNPDSSPDDPQSELRPYGPGGEWVCYGCTFNSDHPEREQQAEAAFVTLLDASETISPSGKA